MDAQTSPKGFSPTDWREIVGNPIDETRIVERKEEKVVGSEDPTVFQRGW